MQSSSEFLSKYPQIARQKTEKSALRLFLLGILAGFLIGMGALTSTLASYSITNPSLAKLVKGLVFPFGLILVIFTGAELFTGNNLLFIAYFQGEIKLSRMLRNWGIVYLGNLLGSIMLAGLYVISGNFGLQGKVSPGNLDLAISIMNTANSKVSLAFGQAVVLGVLCNFLVCLAVMCALMNQDGISKAVAAFLPVAFFVWAGFEHSVANMYYIPAGLLLKAVPELAKQVTAAGLDFSNLTWGNFFLKNLIPVTLGNILGGFFYSALVYLSFSKLKTDE